jgi:MFS family permease
MTVPVYTVALVIALTLGISADRTGHKAYHTMGACAMGCVSFIICATVSDFKVRYVFICFGGAGIWSATPLFLSWMVTMFEGREKRAISIALINGFGNLASVYGSFLWPSNEAPGYKTGFGVTTALIGSAGLMAVVLKWRYGDKGVLGRAARK